MGKEWESAPRVSGFCCPTPKLWKFLKFEEFEQKDENKWQNRDQTLKECFRKFFY